MHRQSSTHSLRALKSASYHFLFNILLAISGIVIIGCGLVIQEKLWVTIGASCLLFTGLSIAVFFLRCYSWRCPLCIGRVWVKSGCRRHRKAVKAMGISYRLGVATAVIRHKPYRCPYCGEPFSSTQSLR
ncbi:hypothetical protein NT6N_12900 [Oceaniferula spumae]|uniref:Uncharacterized protein n=1 Tax=Oceaniferula spumae TaxID=2979115 RepID=A0AAT9FJR3_9BACT